MLNYLILVTENVTVTAILLGLLCAVTSAALGRAGKRALAIGAVAGFALAAVVAVLKNATKVIDKLGGQGVWNTRIFALSLLALIVWWICSPRRVREKLGAVPAAAAAGVLAFTLLFYAMPDVLLELRHVSKIYGSLRALDDVSLAVDNGEWVAIMGPSGSGKSTMMNIIGCMDKPSEGEVLLDGKDIAKESEKSLTAIRRDKIGLIFQQFHLVNYLTAVENVMGGISVNERHKTSFPGLYAAGECACQYHGANRLGGNSLLGAIYGGRVAAQSVLDGDISGGRIKPLGPAALPTVSGLSSKNCGTSCWAAWASSATANRSKRHSRRWIAGSPRRTCPQRSGTGPFWAGPCCCLPWPAGRAGAPTPAQTFRSRTTNIFKRPRCVSAGTGP